MAATYKDFQRQPSKPHQCMHHSEKDGIRCRAASMHNEYMCYQHRSDDIATVIENDPFLIERLDDRAAIQHAVTQVAARLACNHMDLKRAGLLLQALQIAVTNLSAPPPTLLPTVPDSGPEFAPDREPAQDLEPATSPSASTQILTLHAVAAQAPLNSHPTSNLEPGTRRTARLHSRMGSSGQPLACWDFRTARWIQPPIVMLDGLVTTRR